MSFDLIFGSGESKHQGKNVNEIGETKTEFKGMVTIAISDL